MKFRLGELFSGPGGIALGTTSAKVQAGSTVFSIEHVWANDHDADSCNTYRRNICPTQPTTVICRDVRKLAFSDLPPIDALAFGFPCNDFSVVGEQKGMEGPYGPLYSYGVKALTYFQPKWFFAENVGGLRSANDGRAFEVILRELVEAGYKVTPHFYRFEEYGVPQARHRIAIIGIRSDIKIDFPIPAPIPEPFKTAREAIDYPPISPDAHNHEYTKQSAHVIERLRHIKPGENAFTATLPEHLKINAKVQMSLIYRRLDPNKPAYTVTGSGGGGTHVYHWSEDRALTNRERARLQTFPDSYVFSGSKESVRRQIGMALPPVGAKLIAEAVLKSFADIPYPSIDPNMNGQMSFKMEQGLALG